jgi:hypothetical protein
VPPPSAPEALCTGVRPAFNFFFLALLDILSIDGARASEYYFDFIVFDFTFDFPFSSCGFLIFVIFYAKSPRQDVGHGAAVGLHQLVWRCRLRFALRPAGLPPRHLHREV